MPIVPEKHQLEDHVHGALAAQFWSQGIENTRSLTGQACTAPCEPQPLRLHAPSGLSRTQFLVAAHAVRVPVFPGFCEEHGGTVADRVLLQSGGQKWWGAIIGRAKLQRGIKQRSATTLRRNLADPNNYALAATGRLQISSSTSLKLTAQVDSLAHLQPLMPQGGRIWQQQQQQQRGWAKMGQASSLSMQLKQQLEGLDLTADLALNEPSVEGVRRYATTPLRLAVDLAPSSSSSRHGGSSSRLKGLLFRVGLHGVVAPVEGGAAGDAQPQQQQQQQHALSVHCQGAVALSGSKTVWEAAQKPWQSAAAAAKEQRAKQQKQRQRQLEAAQQAVQEQDQQRQQQQQADLQVQPLQLDSSNDTGAGHSTDAAPPPAVTSGAGASTGGDAAGPAAAAAAAAGSSDQQTASSKHHRHHHHHKSSTTTSSSSRHATAKSGSTSAATTVANSSSNNRSSSQPCPAGRKRYLTLQGQEIALPLLSPAAVQDTLQESGSRLERLRSELRQLRGRVEAGELAQLGSGKKAGGLLSGLGKQAGSCWSSFLAGPHFKVSGLVGLLGRVPLQQRTLLLPGSTSTHPHQPPLHSSSTGSLASTSTADGAASSSTAADNVPAAAAAAVPSGRPLGSKARSFLAASATHLDRLVLGSAKKLGSNIRQESQLRLFGSGGASLQFGEMRGNFFDYTRLEAALDLGLNAPETSSAAATAAAAAAANNSAAGGSRSSHRQQRTAAKGGGQQRAPGRGMGSILGPAAAVELAAPAAAAAAANLPAAPAAPAPAAAAVPAGSRQQQQPASKHPAFALEDRCVWNALTLSASQQLVGPVRLRGDWRFALDSKHACPSGMGLLQPSAPLALLRHVGGITPALVDSAYGVDVVVSGAGGLVRLVGWLSPGRREGGLELRLM